VIRAGGAGLRPAGLGRLAAGGGGLDSHSVVLGYPTALLPLPALLCAVAIGAMALIEMVQRRRWTWATAPKWSDRTAVPKVMLMTPKPSLRRLFAGHAGADGHRHEHGAGPGAHRRGMAWVLDFWDTQLLAQNLVAGVDSFPLLAVPFFILAGELMNSGGISRRIIDMAQAWVGHIRGGLGYVAIGAAVLMASMSGSALADTAALATILLPMMRQQGYPMNTSAGLVAGRHHRAHHPAVDALRDLRRHHQHLDLGAVRLGHRARADHGRGPDRGLEVGAAPHRPAGGRAAADARAAAATARPSGRC
jgi:hypothetical protein